MVGNFTKRKREKRKESTDNAQRRYREARDIDSSSQRVVAVIMMTHMIRADDLGLWGLVETQKKISPWS